MTRIVMTTLLLMLATASLAGADIFKCRLPDGTIVFADNPVAADCTMERVEDLPVLGVLPEAPARPPAAPTAADSGSQASDRGVKPYEAYASEVSALVEQHQAARKRLYRASLARDKQEARSELSDLKAQMSSLADEIEQSELSGAEKRALLEQLVITGE